MSEAASDLALSKEFERCRPYIEAALERDFGSHSIADVWELIRSRQVQFWASQRSAAVSVIFTRPRSKVLEIWLAGGDLAELQQIEKGICSWAENQGCDTVIVNGRRGWLKVLEGYAEGSTVLVKRL